MTDRIFRPNMNKQDYHHVLAQNLAEPQETDGLAFPSLDDIPYSAAEPTASRLEVIPSRFGQGGHFFHENPAPNEAIGARYQR